MKQKSNPNEILLKAILKTRPKAQTDLNSLKRRFSKNFKIACPTNIDLLKTYHTLLKNKRIKKSKYIEILLTTRPVRSLSGIVNISVLTKPYPCPGKCVFCPTEKGFPKSYLAGEPAAQRAKNLNFDPFLQVKKRLQMLENQGHATDKIELRVIGGTWSFYPKQYQTWFIKRCFQACNEKNLKLNPPVGRLKFKNQSLETAQRLNEKTKNRIVGLSIETKPSFITEKEILRLRKLGATMIELGVQTVFDDVLKKCQTGITAAQIASATKLLKDAGFKVLYQVMPNLPGSNPKKDLRCFKMLFGDESFLPDWLKIYPCVVCKNSLLYKWYKNKKHRPYSDKELIELLIEIKKILPYWTKVARLFRDIPSQSIEAGSKLSNLREIVQKKLREKKIRCNCIRCREVRKSYNPDEKIYLFKKTYKGSDGKEIFLSFENKKRTKLLSFLRLRIPSYVFWTSEGRPSHAFRASEDKPSFSAINSKFKTGQKHFISVLNNASIIRELQTFGPQIPISERRSALPYQNKVRYGTNPEPKQGFWFGAQHRGLGKKLIREAENITRSEFGLKKIAVISGIGAREYYQKLGYELKSSYMVKEL